MNSRTLRLCKSIQRKHIPSTINRHLSTQGNNDSPTVGFVGLGIMGMGMAKNLLKNNVPLNVWNRSKEKLQELKNEYGSLVTISPTPAAVVAQCTTTISMLSTPEAMRAVYDKEGDGLLAGISSGKHIIECGTYRPEDMCVSSEAVKARGGSFLEAPVSGSKMPAANGQLIFICSGDKEVLDASTGYLKMMGKSHFYFGSTVGDGSKIKLVINSIMGNMLACLSEGIHVTQNQKLDASILLDIISESAIANPMFALKGPNMVKGANQDKDVEALYAPHFPLKHAHKDIKFAMGLSAPGEARMSSAACDVYAQAIDQHALGDLDFSAVHEATSTSSKQ